MTSVQTRSRVRIGRPLARAVAATLAFAAVAPAAWSQQSTAGALEEIVVIATRREASLQTIPVAVSAFTGQALVIRGPQGVLLGKNVVSSALSVITTSPSQQASSEVTASYGNYSAILPGRNVCIELRGLKNG